MLKWFVGLIDLEQHIARVKSHIKNEKGYTQSITT